MEHRKIPLNHIKLFVRLCQCCPLCLEVALPINCHLIISTREAIGLNLGLPAWEVCDLPLRYNLRRELLLVCGREHCGSEHDFSKLISQFSSLKAHIGPGGSEAYDLHEDCTPWMSGSSPLRHSSSSDRHSGQPYFCLEEQLPVTCHIFLYKYKCKAVTMELQLEDF